MNIAHPF